MKVVATKHFPFGKFVAINMFARLYLIKSLMEEIADVRIVIERIMRKYGIKEDDIDKLVVFKINRFIDRYGI